MMPRLSIAIALAIAALSTLAVASASAETGGHFIYGTTHPILLGTEDQEHHLDFTMAGLSGEIGCNSTYEGTGLTETAEFLQLVPTYKECLLTGSSTKVTIDTNGCVFTFKVAPVNVEQTFDLVCPPGWKLTITRPNCTIAIPGQTNISGITYTKIEEEGQRQLTVNVNSQLSVQYEAGECTSLGTNQTGTLKGAFLIRAYNTNGELRTITATSSEIPGHFYSAVEHATIVGSEAGEHHLHFSVHGLEGEIGCEKTTYQSTRIKKAVQVLALTPVLESCKTTGGEAALVGFGECQVVLRVATKTTSETEQTADLTCPAGKSVLIIFSPNCVTRVPPQSNIGKITYTTIEESGKHALTMDVNAEISVQREFGPCAMLGTNGTGTLKGSITIKAQNTAGEQVSLTAT